MFTVTFFLHTGTEAFLESAGRATAAIISVDGAIVVPSTRVRSAVANRALKEAFTAFTCTDSVVLPSGFIPANSAV